MPFAKQKNLKHGALKVQIKQPLIKELHEIVELTTKQNNHYLRGQAYLYEGFESVIYGGLQVKSSVT